MSGEGIKARERFLANMQKVAIGSKLARHRAVWTVTNHKRMDGSIALQLQCGRRSLRTVITVSHWGPDLADAGLRSVHLAPIQREFFATEAA